MVGGSEFWSSEISCGGGVWGGGRVGLNFGQLKFPGVGEGRCVFFLGEGGTGLKVDQLKCLGVGRLSTYIHTHITDWISRALLRIKMEIIRTCNQFILIRLSFSR